MFFKAMVLFLLLLLMNLVASDVGIDFTYNGFRGANVSLNGIAEITSNGLLRLTNKTEQKIGRAFYPIPIHFKNLLDGNTHSFSTTFVFAIVPEDPDLSGHGIAFVVSPSKELPKALPSQYLGLFYPANNGNSSNHVVAIELDTILSSEFDDINDNHVGIDIDGLNSTQSSPATYFTSDNGMFKNLSLISGEPMQVWIEYNGIQKQLEVRISPINVPKPDLPLLSSSIDLSKIILDSMYVGFSSSTGSMLTTHYILGWSFKLNGQSQPLDLSRLPKLPQSGSREKLKALMIGLPSIVVVFALVTMLIIVITERRKIKFDEILEDWEREYGPQRFLYKDLYVATNGFEDKELLGIGGFGRVYRGLLPSSNIEVAVKRVSHESRQGMREFIAEIVSLGRLRHRNLVRLLGYCRREGELLLVYDFMPNGSLDKSLFDQPKKILNWSQRFRIIKGVASALLYLHEQWEQIVLHRDIKASNVLLDGELNGRLGDFGLARLYDHGTNPQTTHVVGTLGYIAPELTKTGKATTRTDVFSFGAFMLEVACGRRPIDPRATPEEIILVDWVFECWRKGSIHEASDRKLGNGYVAQEMELVLKLGLLCSHPLESTRPSMKQVTQFLEGDAALPELSSVGFNASVSASGLDKRLDDPMSCPPSITVSFVSEGR